MTMPRFKLSQLNPFAVKLRMPHTLFSGIGGRLSLMLLMTALGFVAIGAVTYFATEEIEERWAYFRDNVAKRIELLEDIRQHIGYGGVIHHFKNFVLRKEEPYLVAFDLSFIQLEKAVEQYIQMDLSTQEQHMLATVRKTLNQYDKLRFYILESVIDSDMTSAQIDTQVKVNDGPALEAMKALNSAIESLEAEQTQLLEQRLQQSQQLIFSVIIGTMLLVIIITLLTVRQVLKALKQAVQVANNIAEGNLANTIKAHDKDETGQLLTALATMQNQLRDRIAQEKRVANEALRINRALDSVSTSVVIADNAYEIIYANPAAEHLFAQYTEQLQTHLPDLNPQQLTAQPLAVFYPQADRQYSQFGQLTNRLHSQLELSNLTIEYTATPVINAAGERIGLVKEFHDRSLEVQTQVEIKQAIEAASQGDFAQRVNLTDKTGFFLNFSQGLNQIMDYNQQAIGDVVDVFAALAQGDLTRSIHNDYQGEFGKLKADANLTIQKLTETLDIIQQIADVVNEAAENLSNNSADLSQRAEQQAASLEQTAASMEEMNSTVQQNTENVRQVQQVAVAVAKQAAEGGEVVEQAIGAMQAINDSSRKVSDIIGVIDEIAFQTNLLALNAAVEAARAGEQGRGFAVVANEVRNLAQRSATAAKEIKLLISDSVEKVGEGTRLVNQSGETLTEMLEGVQKVNNFMSDIANASQDQAAGIEQVTQAITHMESMTQQSTYLVQQTATASEGMAKQAQQLRQRVAFFTLKTTTETA